MRNVLIAGLTATLIACIAQPSFAQSAPGQTVNVTPNQQTTQASAVSSPSGQNISQQNNFYDPGSNAFGPGIQCAGPYIASSIYRNDSSNPGSAASGFANVGGTIGLVVPLNGSNKKCQEFVNEIVFQRQIDTCLTMLRAGFSFDPNGQYANLAKRCSGIHFSGQPNANAAPLSPPPPPTVITVPANPASNAVPLPIVPGLRSDASPAARPDAVQPAAVAVAPTRATNAKSYCQTIAPERKHELIARFKNGTNRREALEELHAACVPDSELTAALARNG